MKAPAWSLLSTLLLVISCDSKETADQDEKAEDEVAAPSDAARAKAEDAIAKAVPSAVGQAADTRDFGVESAKITFAYTGFEEGTLTAWVQDYGGTVALHRQMTKPMPNENRSVWKDAETTQWQPGGEPFRTKLRIKESELRLVSTQDPKQLEMAGYVKKANETVAGKDCEVWHSERQNVTLWRWQGIDLKYVNGAVSGVTQTVEATEVVTPAVIPAEALGG